MIIVAAIPMIMIFIVAVIILIIIAVVIKVKFKDQRTKLRTTGVVTISRKVAGVIGLTLLLLVFSLSIKDLNNMYNVEFKKLTTHGPTLPVKKNKPNETIRNFRVLAHIIAVNKKTGEVTACFEKILTSDDNKMPLNFDYKGITLEGYVRVDSIGGYGVNGKLKVSLQSFSHHSSRSYGLYESGNLTSAKKAASFTKAQIFREKSFFSLQKNESEVISFYSFMSPLHPDDKLKEISVDELLGQLEGRQYGDNWQGYYRRTPIQALLMTTGPSALIFFLGVLLFTQLFRRRNLAFSSLMTVAILMCIILKKSEFNTHKSAAQNSELSLSQRQVAAKNCHESILYGKSGQKVYEEVMNLTINN
jgi:hypothetical protein